MRKILTAIAAAITVSIALVAVSNTANAQWRYRAGYRAAAWGYGGYHRVGWRYGGYGYRGGYGRWGYHGWGYRGLGWGYAGYGYPGYGYAGYGYAAYGYAAYGYPAYGYGGYGYAGYGCHSRCAAGRLLSCQLRMVWLRVLVGAESGPPRRSTTS